MLEFKTSLKQVVIVHVVKGDKAKEIFCVIICTVNVCKENFTFFKFVSFYYSF